MCCKSYARWFSTSSSTSSSILRGNTIIRTEVWCVNMGEYMSFQPILSSEYYGVLWYAMVWGDAVLRSAGSS